jgi:hypothetical protein
VNFLIMLTVGSSSLIQRLPLDRLAAMVPSA